MEVGSAPHIYGYIYDIPYFNGLKRFMYGSVSVNISGLLSL